MINIETIRDVFSSKETAKRLNLKDSTFRKYALLLEKHNYSFSRTDAGRRKYTNNDIEVFKRLIELKSKQGMTLEDACRIATGVITKNPPKKEEEVNEISVTHKDNNNELMFKELLDEIQRLKEENKAFRESQIAFNKQLTSKLDEQTHYIEESIKRRDQVTVDSLQISLMERRSVSHRKKKRTGILNKLIVW